MSIASNIRNITTELSGTDVTLVAVTKTHPAETVMHAYQAGLRVFGENKALEMCDKHTALPSDIQWHMIGHLQSNKVKYIAPFVSLIHSIDSLKLLFTVEKEAAKNNRTIDCLLQFHVAEEETKHGLTLEEARVLLKSDGHTQLKNVRLCGIMGMATFTDNQDQVRREFRALHDHFNALKKEFFAQAPHFKTVSMGMSGDYKLAIAEGSNMVRVGSSIFGERGT